MPGSTLYPVLAGCRTLSLSFYFGFSLGQKVFVTIITESHSNRLAFRSHFLQFCYLFISIFISFHYLWSSVLFCCWIASRFAFHIVTNRSQSCYRSRHFTHTQHFCCRTGLPLHLGKRAWLSARRWQCTHGFIGSDLWGLCAPSLTG